MVDAVGRCCRFLVLGQGPPSMLFQVWASHCSQLPTFNEKLPSAGESVVPGKLHSFYPNPGSPQIVVD